jgi:predicted kinase
MRKLVILRWLPASGKSTEAKKLVEEGMKRVNKDLLREMLDFWVWSKANEALVNEIEYDLIQSLLSRGISVVVDDTNISMSRVNLLEAIWMWEDANVEVKLMDTPIEECIKRDANREKSVWEEVIKKFSKQLWPQMTHKPSQL